jgi:type II restriction/modification system DNA methylase subunit YeeA
MPFLFESVDGASELLLPDNLLHSDSIIRKLVSEIDEEDWQQIQIIGWLYQFYISERKDEVIGKVVKSEDIPAATQLFTPNWIVKYMVQNSLGAQWLATYPHSPLKSQMDYYIEPAEQTAEVNAQLSSITPSSLDPEELTLIDPACGSGHILVEAYELFKSIYLERGYRQRDVAKLILEKNLFGLDIDERAAQMTGFALLMKGRADDRRLFERGVKLNVMALLDSVGFDAEVLSNEMDLADFGLSYNDLLSLKEIFAHSSTFGSLIQVPEGLTKKLAALKQLGEVISQNLFVSASLKLLGPLVRQAELLSVQCDAVVANPPYLNSKAMLPNVKSFLKTYYPQGQKDLFAAFVLRSLDWGKQGPSVVAILSPIAWMYLATFEDFRDELLGRVHTKTLVELETNAFEPAMVTVCAFVLSPVRIPLHRGCYIRLVDFKGARNQGPRTLEAIANRNCGWLFEAAQDAFQRIPGKPVAYWISAQVRRLFAGLPELATTCKPLVGLQTGDNESFVRRWSEVDGLNSAFNCRSRTDAQQSKVRWFPYTKGGPFRKWYGNNEFVVDWLDDGLAIRSHRSAVVRNSDFYFRNGISFTNISSAYFGARSTPSGFLFDQSGSMFFSLRSLPVDVELSFLLSNVAGLFLELLSPAMHFNPGKLGKLPFSPGALPVTKIGDNAKRLIENAKQDWDAYELSWEFQSLPLLVVSSDLIPTLEASYNNWITQNSKTVNQMKFLEEENNSLFIEAYDLADELTPDVPIEQITLTVNPAYRYGGKLTEEEMWTRFRQDTMQELVSYAIGCMMGRYSLDEPSLIYAHSGNEGFDPSRYPSFPADDDGIVPVTDMDWFDDDAANRVREFLLAVWGAETLDENLAWLAEILGQKGSEIPVETIRRYLSTSFFKDHLQIYKKRPIYWLFSSGKEKAFECLVYLHRYNESTLSRMRNEYVIPLQGKYSARADYLANEIQQASSASAQKKLQKELDSLKKKQTELAKFDEELRHYADQRISIDLDDGVKVNYGKFGGLLAEVKAVTGEKPKDLL